MQAHSRNIKKSLIPSEWHDFKVSTQYKKCKSKYLIYFKFSITIKGGISKNIAFIKNKFKL